MRAKGWHPKGAAQTRNYFFPPTYHLHTKRRDHVCLAIKQKDFFKIGGRGLCRLLSGRFTVELWKGAWCHGRQKVVEVKEKQIYSTHATYIQKISHSTGVVTHALNDGEYAINLVEGGEQA